ncbi:glycine zipper 2TM domain-containing protein [Herminiimonas sp. CN]|uniref:glycine zipper 2TM domain-containing protein n=1 Tax=Herminiimonas sp. CN TaxID=1349818 RepID=UPI00047380EC|nr:glycine zipper 2TM domain-containing protein [Herminiimonas sp. CN]
MENPQTSGKIHPLVAGAAVSVMLLSLVGVAAMTGLLPNSNSTTAPVAVLASSAPTPATDKISTLAPTTEAKQFVASGGSDPASAAPSQSRHKPVHKSEYKQAYRPAPDYSENAYAPPAQAAVCGNCGTIESVRSIQQAAPQNGVGIGAVAGAVLGGVLGHQVGGGNGRNLATVAGAVGGGFAGNEVERRTRTTTHYQIRVRMEDGSMRSFSDSEQSGWRSGDRVRVVNGSLTSQG